MATGEAANRDERPGNQILGDDTSLTAGQRRQRSHIRVMYSQRALKQEREMRHSTETAVPLFPIATSVLATYLPTRRAPAGGSDDRTQSSGVIPWPGFPRACLRAATVKSSNTQRDFP